MAEVKEKIIKCPKCRVDMSKVKSRSYIIDKCPKCKGIFLDKDEILKINKQGFFRYVTDYFRR
jgi:Zn-finger nucleic acid-binding protein